MDFFERQQKARRHTTLLEIYFALAVLGTIAAVYFGTVIFFKFEAPRWGHAQIAAWNPRLLMAVALGTLAVILGGSLYKISQLARGGSAVAEMLGGRPIAANTTDLDEQKLLHVVEEMAIASGTPVPAVYVLADEMAINAFAAGHSTNDMVICATRGCLKFLTRDELQGVIGHEFSHILNGDMRLNLRLMGIVFGILCLTLVGRVLFSARGRRNNALSLAGLVLLAIGSIGAFFGKLIKSAVSRQREFLADAASVQFTRNPLALAGALKKVGGCGSRIEDPNAEDASHLFFANGLGESFSRFFSTHPPIEERIRELDPAWDGKFTLIGLEAPPNAAPASQKEISPPPWPPPPGAVLAAPIFASTTGAARGAIVSGGFLAGMGAPTGRHLEYAADLKSKLPETLLAAARDPLSAVALVYALLLSQDEAVRSRQLQQLQRDPAIFQETTRLLGCMHSLESRAKLPLVTISMTALRHLSPPQYETFRDTIECLIDSDGQIDLFEYMLQKTVRRRLEPNFKPIGKPVIQFYVLKPVVTDCAVLLSALARVGQTDPAAMERAFLQGARQLGVTEPDLRLLEPAQSDLSHVDCALERLNQTIPHLKKQVLAACAETVAADGVILEQEAELLRAIADSLDCPIPPHLVL
jgi:Zn-dependent protease with chaperone function